MTLQLSIDLRPKRFGQIVGQDHVCALLRKTKVRNYFPRVMLLSGPCGVGKTTLARIWAAYVNCTSENVTEQQEPCGTCPNCLGVFGGYSELVTEIEAAVHRKVEDMDPIRSLASYATPAGARRVVIIDEFHAISQTGQESLLHTFEASSDTTFVLTTTEPRSILDPILSRCFSINLAPVSYSDRLALVEQYFTEAKIQVEPGVTDLVARASSLGMRSVWQAVDKLRVDCGDEMATLDATQSTLGVPTGASLEAAITALMTSFVDSMSTCMGLAERGVDWVLFVDSICRFAEDCIITIETGEIRSSVGISEDFPLISKHRCLRIMEGLHELRSLDWRYGVSRLYTIFVESNSAAAAPPAEVVQLPAGVSVAPASKLATKTELLGSDPVWAKVCNHLNMRVVEAHG